MEMADKRLARAAISVGLAAGVANVITLLYVFIHSMLYKPYFEFTLHQDPLMLAGSAVGLAGALVGTYLLVRRYPVRRATRAALGAFLSCSGMSFLLFLLPFVAPGGVVVVITNALHEVLAEVALITWVLVYAAGMAYLVASGEVARALAPRAARRLARRAPNAPLAAVSLALVAIAMWAAVQSLYAIAVCAGAAALILALAAAVGSPRRRGRR